MKSTQLHRNEWLDANEGLAGLPQFTHRLREAEWLACGHTANAQQRGAQSLTRCVYLKLWCLVPQSEPLKQSCLIGYNPPLQGNRYILWGSPRGIVWESGICTLRLGNPFISNT